MQDSLPVEWLLGLSVVKIIALSAMTFCVYDCVRYFINQFKPSRTFIVRVTDELVLLPLFGGESLRYFSGWDLHLHVLSKDASEVAAHDTKQ